MNRTEIIAARRRRRLAERRRQAARRRRNALCAAAATAFVGGILAGAGGERSGIAEPQSVSAMQPAPPVPTVEDFRGPVPILMYHAIAEAPQGSEYPELFVTPDVLRAQVRALARAGFNAVTLGQVFAAWDKGEPIARNPIVLSFDDGLRSQYMEAFPALARKAWPGVLNLKVEALDQGELTDEMVTEMLDSGWELGAHTISHSDLTRLGRAERELEIAGARRQLAERFGETVDFICYPGGSFNVAVIKAAKRAGYVGATTTQPGVAVPKSDPFELPRIRVDRSDGVEGLLSKLRAQGLDA